MKIGKYIIADNEKTFFIADIAANHDGKLDRAIDLIKRAAEAGANAAKFQNFKAKTIVSDFGFKQIGSKQSHQSEWKDSVYKIYDKASIAMEWTITLRDACRDAGIEYFTAPYDLELVEELQNYVAAWKIGSGDITWLEMIEKLAKKNLPLLIATGASSIEDVQRAMKVAQKHTKNIALMQCNTNYTASSENFKYINLNVLDTYKQLFPEFILGLSDHTYGHTTVLGAITKGARLIEKHFTDDNTREGPDHKFSMNPTSWKEMINAAKELENALGDGEKRIEDNEKETAVLQQRSLRARANLIKGEILTRDHLIPLRPCPKNSIKPFEIDKLLGKRLNKDKVEGDNILIEDIE